MPPFKKRALPFSVHTQMIITGLLVGSFSGLAAVGLNHMLRHGHHWYSRFSSPWLTLILPVAGIGLTVWILRFLIKDRPGHGIPEVIHSVSMKGGVLPLKLSYSRLLGCFLTLSSGGSAGPEAPVVISGAAIGSALGRSFQVSEKLVCAAVGAGASAAIAAIFNAPVAAIIFTMEVIIGEWSSASLLPVAMASATGTIISWMFKGKQIPFPHRLMSVNLEDVLASVGLALLTALVSILLLKIMKKTGALARKLPWRHPLLIAATGGLLIGALGLAFPQVRGEGYEWIRRLLQGEAIAAPAFLGLLILIKIIATALTVQAGGVGGIFAPSLFLGAVSGSIYFSLLTLVFPTAHFCGSPFFILAGMAGVISGTLQAPLTGLFLILEITGGYETILPLIVTVFLSSVITRRTQRYSVYHQELIEQGFLRRPRTDQRILSDLTVSELLETDCLHVHPMQTFQELLPVIENSRRNYLAVVEEGTSRFIGLVNLQDIRGILLSPALWPTLIVEEMMRIPELTVSPQDNVADILDLFDQSGEWSLPVLENERFLGLVSKATLLDHYRRELIAQTDM